MRTGNSLLCSKQESLELVNSIQQEADKICEEFNELYNTTEPVSVCVKSVKFEMGHGVTADMYFGDSLIKTYPLAEMAIIDLTMLVMKAYQSVLGTMEEKIKCH